jgi:alkanesulfonate monooxygenase SsuD/methylene tetrahydromethanopterin reductase-like flavin-dependent oxidoreductase (luciferase family)
MSARVPVKFGLIYDFRNPLQWRREWHDLYSELLQQIETAESLGFEEIWLTEHHFAQDGYLPSLFPMAAAIASRTQNIRIGTNALLAAIHHPLRVAEDAAIVDILSRGRLDLGLALGFRQLEFRQFGIEFDLARRVERLKDVVGALKHAYDGAYMDQPVCPAPLQKPHPPIYVGANVDSALKALAPLGLPLMLIGGKDKLTMYSQAQRAAGLDISAIPAPVQSLGMFLFVAEDHDLAWKTAMPHVRYAVEQDVLWSGRTRLVSDSDLKRFGVVGAPDEVADSIAQKIQDIRPSQACFFANPPGMAPEVATQSLRLFARYVRPLVEEKLA